MEIRSISVRRARSLRVALLVLAMLAGGGMAVHAQDSTDWAKVEAAAKKEGRLVFYTAGASEMVPNILKKFESRFGIPVDLLTARGPELRERLRTERAAGRSVADIVHSGNTIRTIDPALIVKHPPLQGASKITVPTKDDGVWAPVNIAPFIPLINTSLIKPQDEPVNWTDLVDPRWKGKILLDDPRSPGQGNSTVMVLYEKFGRSFLDKLAAQNPVLTRDTIVTERRVAQGEYPIFVPSTTSSLVRLDGLPIKAIAPREGMIYTTGVAAIVAGAPHPNAALLMLNYMLSDEAQEIVSESASISPIGVVSAKLPPVIKTIVQSPLLAESDPDKLEAATNLFKEIFK